MPGRIRDGGVPQLWHQGSLTPRRVTRTAALIQAKAQVGNYAIHDDRATNSAAPPPTIGAPMTTMQDLAREAVPYGIPTVDLHRILVRFALDPSSPEFKAPLNQLGHATGLADPSDKAVVAMNVDTPYSWAWLDLRGGPVMLTMPPHESDRYMSAQIVDLYTYIVGYVTPRTQGNGGGRFAVRGPSSAGAAIASDVDGVFECPTDLALVLIRTQLFDDGDLPAVHQLQSQITLDAPTNIPPMPTTVPVVDVRAPLDGSFLTALDWMLEFMPPLADDTRIRQDLSGLGIGVEALTAILDEPTIADEIRQGLALGMQDVHDRSASVRSSAELFGSREFFAGDHLTRAAGAVLGILGNAAEEYLGVGYRGDEAGEPFDGARRYRITFAPDALPPVGAFWSITVYDAAGHLHDSPLHRFVLGSRQVPHMVRDADGGLTLHVQHEAPPEQANWLPCPATTFGLTFRTYLPSEEIRSGRWTAPPVRRVE